MLLFVKSLMLLAASTAIMNGHAFYLKVCLLLSVVFIEEYIKTVAIKSSRWTESSALVMPIIYGLTEALYKIYNLSAWHDTHNGVLLSVGGFFSPIPMHITLGLIALAFHIRGNSFGVILLSCSALHILFNAVRVYFDKMAESVYIVDMSAFAIISAAIYFYVRNNISARDC